MGTTASAFIPYAAASEAKAAAAAKAAAEARIALVTAKSGSLCSAAASEAKAAAAVKAAAEARIALVMAKSGSLCSAAAFDAKSAVAAKAAFDAKSAVAAKAAFDAKSAVAAKAAFDAKSAVAAKAAAEYNGDFVWDYRKKNVVVVVDYNNICPKGLYAAVKRALKYYAKLYNVVAVYIVASDVNEKDNQFLLSLFGMSYTLFTFTREQNGTEGEIVDVSIAKIIQAMLTTPNLDKMVIFSGDGNKDLGKSSICTAIMDVVAKRPPKFVVVCAPLLSMHTDYKQHDDIEKTDLNDFSSKLSLQSGGSVRCASPSGGSDRSARSTCASPSAQSTCASPSLGGFELIPPQTRCPYWDRGGCKFGSRCRNAVAHN